MPPGPKPPSVSSLATALATPEPLALASQTPRMAIAAPPPRERALIAIALVLLPLVAASLLALGWGLWQLRSAVAGEIRERERRLREDLPADAVLLDGEGWRQAAAARPLAAGNILLARCRLLAAGRRWGELDESVAGMARLDPGSVLPGSRLLRVEALLALGRTGEAADQLHRLDGRTMDPDDQARVATLAGRLWTATAPPAKPRSSVLRPTEQPEQPPPE